MRMLIRFACCFLARLPVVVFGGGPLCQWAGVSKDSRAKEG
jgi:hypothetical protein